jgi:hypothetical protein
MEWDRGRHSRKDKGVHNKNPRHTHKAHTRAGACMGIHVCGLYVSERLYCHEGP